MKPHLTRWLGLWRCKTVCQSYLEETCHVCPSEALRL